MHVPSEAEMAAIALAYFALQREETLPATPISRWRLAARALPHEPRRTRWRSANQTW